MFQNNKMITIEFQSSQFNFRIETNGFSERSTMNNIKELLKEVKTIAVEPRVPAHMRGIS